MNDSACFVQFPHPGDERDAELGTAWSPYYVGERCIDHARKFMQLHGNWVAGDGTGHSGELWAWGEWEAQSELVRDLDTSGGPGLPRHLWRPYYVIPPEGYEGLHNTDPFIFGNEFLYSNCKQPARPGLRRLGRGSVIAFGSKRGGWVLDTVLVVASHVDYAVPEACLALADEAPEAFLAVTAGPLADSGEEATLRLYRGATPDDPVNGMFSFFPAMPAGRNVGFERPDVELDPSYFTKTLPLNYKRSCGLPSELLRSLWEQLVAQVHDAGLVLGTYAELPEQSET